MNKKPNIILITTDQQRTDTLGCYGNPIMNTPHLDQLSAEGIQMDRSYVNNPVCMPSRASIMTGRYPRSHGLTVNGKPLPKHETTLADLLGSAGYDTAVLGKVHLGPTGAKDTDTYIESKKMDEAGKSFFRNWNGPYYGFDYVQLSVGHATGGNKGHYRLWLEENHPEALKHFDDPKKNAIEPPSGAPFGSLKWGLPAEAHNSTWVAEKTCDFMDEHTRQKGDRPFFAWVSFQDPHAPLACPAPYCYQYNPKTVPQPIAAPDQWDELPPHFGAKFKGEMDDFQMHAGGFRFPGGGGGLDAAKVTEQRVGEMIAHYYGMVSLIDDQVGRILDKLKQLELVEDTIVIFTSDHGELLGDHGLWMKGPYHYESLIRIPMIWRYPGHIKGGVKSSALMSHIDIAATLLEFAGLEPAEGIQGVSQAELFKGNVENLREEALCEFRVHHDTKAINAKTLITERYKLTYYAGYEFGEMYDLEHDPREEKNLWNQPEQEPKKEELLKKLFKQLVQTEDPLPVQLSNY